MTYKLHPKAIDAISNLSVEDRYRHFLAKVADWRECYVSVTDRGVLMWPHPAFAERFFKKSREPELITLEALIQWLDSGSTRHSEIYVFPVSLNDDGYQVSWHQLQSDLVGELGTLGEDWGESDDDYSEPVFKLRADIELESQAGAKRNQL